MPVVEPNGVSALEQDHVRDQVGLGRFDDQMLTNGREAVRMRREGMLLHRR